MENENFSYDFCKEILNQTIIEKFVKKIDQLKNQSKDNDIYL